MLFVDSLARVRDVEPVLEVANLDDERVLVVGHRVREQVLEQPWSRLLSASTDRSAVTRRVTSPAGTISQADSATAAVSSG